MDEFCEVSEHSCGDVLLVSAQLPARHFQQGGWTAVSLLSRGEQAQSLSLGQKEEAS